MNLLNLDELVGITRTIVLKGTTYNIHEQTIGNLVENVKMANSMKSDDETAMFEAMVSAAKQILPDAPEEDIRGLTLIQIQALIRFANASDIELTEATKETEEAEQGKA